MLQKDERKHYVMSVGAGEFVFEQQVKKISDFLIFSTVFFLLKSDL